MHARKEENKALSGSNAFKTFIEKLSQTSGHASLLLALFNRVQDSIIIIDDLGNIKDANEAAIKLFEYTLPELLRLKLTDIIFESDGEPLNYPVEQLFSESFSGQNYCIRIKSHIAVPVIIKAERNFVKGLSFIIIEEPAEREDKFSQKDLAEFKLIKHMFEGSSIGVEIFNTKGKLLLINRTCLSMYGVETDDEIRKINLFDLPHIGTKIRNALNRSYSAPIETVIDFEDIKKRNLFATSRTGVTDINLSLTILKHEEGKKVFGFMLHLQDITQKKLIEKQLLNYNKELIANKKIIEEKARELAKLNEKLEISERKLLSMNAKRDKFFSLLAHDLKAPFNSLLGFSEYLTAYSADMSVQELQDFGASMHKSAQKLFNLLENLLQWTRFQTGRFPFNPSKLNINDMVEQVSELYSESAKQKNISIINLTDKNHHVLADWNMATTIMRNLLSNAIKYSYSGGSIQISSTEKRKSIFISVTDSGRGMDNETLKNLFEIDSKISMKGTANESGTGLGLIICAEFVKKNKGILKAESIEGKGAVFTFSLPKEKIKN